jgi:predicted Zn-dependent peptidase
MLRSAIGSLLLAWVWGGSALAQGDRAPNPSALGPAVPSAIVVEERTLGNGLRVIVATRPGTGAVVCRVLVKSGFADDPAGEAGLALYLARLYDQGTQLIGVREADKEKESRRGVENFEVTYRSFFREAMEQHRRGEGPDPTDPTSRPAPLQKLRDVLAALEERHQRDLIPGEQHSLYSRAGASELETHVGMDSTAFGATLPASRLEVFFALESDRFRNAIFRDHAATRDQIRREWVAMRDEDPTFRARDAFRSTLWSGHPYGSPAAGSDSLDGIPQDWIERERQRRYVASNMAVLVVGDVAAPPVFDLAERYLGMLPGGAPRDDAPPSPPRAAGPLRMESEAWAPASVSLAWVGPGTAHRDFATLLTAAEILEARGAAAVSVDAHRHGGLFLVSSDAGANDRLPKTEEALRGAIEALRAGRVPNDELSRARRAAAAKFLDALADLRSFANYLARAELSTSPRELADLPKKIAAVSAEDIQRAAQEFLPDATRATLVMRRTKSAPLPKYEAPPPPKPAPPESKPNKAEAGPPASAPAKVETPPTSQPAPGPATASQPAAAQPTASQPAHPKATPTAESRPASQPAAHTAAPATATPAVAPAPAPKPEAAASQPAAAQAVASQPAASQPAKVGTP